MVGGGVGAGAREAVEQAWPTGAHAFPAATLIINLVGSFVLGVLLEVLVRTGEDVGWRRRARLLVGTGFCGGFTTYSTFAVEAVQLARHDAWLTATAYVGVSVVGGLLAAVAGIAAGSRHARWTTAWLPVDPDVDQMRRGS